MSVGVVGTPPNLQVEKLKVYISSAPSDKTPVEIFGRRLEGAGIEAWWIGEVTPGEDMQKIRGEKLVEADCYIYCIFSKIDDNESSINKDIDFGLDRKISNRNLYLLSVTTKNRSVPHKLKKDYPEVELFKEDGVTLIEDEFQRIIESLAEEANRLGKAPVNVSQNMPAVQTPPNQPTASNKATTRGINDVDIDHSAKSDRSINLPTDDKLKFKFYVEALSAYILSEETSAPLTIGINGAWGSGKSSLMALVKTRLESGQQEQQDTKKKEGILKRLYKALKLDKAFRFLKLDKAFRLLKLKRGVRFLKRWKILVEGLLWDIFWIPILRSLVALVQTVRGKNFGKAFKDLGEKGAVKPLTVWFNAWQYNLDEQIWAALALAVLKEIKREYCWPLKLAFALGLSWRRLSIFELFLEFFKKILPPVLVFLGAVLISAIVNLFGDNPVLNLFSFLLTPINFFGLNLFTVIAPILMLFIGGYRTTKDPFKLDIKEILKKPNYDEKVGFIGQYQEDFNHIVDLAVSQGARWKKRKLVIFIDDLDRCKYLQVVGIMEAVNLLMDNEHCIFVIAMDPFVIAANIEAKYKDLTEKMRRETPGVISPGALFLEKIVQVPFNLPRPTAKDIENLVEELTKDKQITPVVNGTPQNGQNTTAPALASPSTPTNGQATSPNNTADPAEPVIKLESVIERQEVKKAIKKATKLLQRNPRYIKRFINIFWLQVYIANKTGLFREIKQQDPGISTGFTLERMAIWLALSMRWPELIRYLQQESYHVHIRKYICEVIEALQEELQANTPAQPANGAAQPANPVSKLQGFKDRLVQTRKNEKDTLYHWVHLPWEVWWQDSDFIEIINEFKKDWPILTEDAPDWIVDLLEMNMRTTS